MFKLLLALLAAVTLTACTVVNEADQGQQHMSEDHPALEDAPY